MAVHRRRRSAVRPDRPPGRPAHPQAQGPLSRGGDARLRAAHCHRADQRGGLDRRPRRHHGAGAHAARVAPPRFGCLVLDRRRDLPYRRHARAQLDRQPDRPRAQGDPRQRSGRLSPRHQRGAQEARRLRHIGNLRLGRRILPGAPERAYYAGHLRFPALDRAGGDGRAGRHGIGHGLAGRGRGARPAAADANHPARVRAHGARSRADGIHDLPAPGHRAEPGGRHCKAVAVTILAAERLSITFGGVRAIDGVSLAVRAGLVFSIIGPNGAGKTTLFNMFSGLYVPQEGHVRLAGEDVTGLASDRLARRGLARTFQNLQIFFRMTTLENVMVGRHRHETTRIVSDLLHVPAVARQNHRTREAARAALARVRLADHGNLPAGALPYGALKRLEIARALASEPKVLLLDEPAAGCNPVETQELEVIIRSIVEDGVTVVLVEHDMRLVMNISDRIHVLANGRSLAEGTAAEVRASPAVIEAYLGTHGSQEAARAAG